MSQLDTNTSKLRNLLNKINELPTASTEDLSSSLDAQEAKLNTLLSTLDGKAAVGEVTLQAKTVSPTTSQQSVTPDSGYDGLSSVTVNAIQTETKTVSPAPSEQSITPTSGKYLTKVTVEAIPAVTQATPSIAVDSNGEITASSTQTEGYVVGGTKTATKQLTVQAAKTVIPTTSNQTAVSSGRYTTGAVTVAGDSNLKASNIVKGVSIFGVAGSHECDSGVDVSGVTATADKVLTGSKFVTADGVLTDGTMVDLSIAESIRVSGLQDDGEKLITPNPMVFRGYLGDAKIFAEYETVASAINLTSDKIAEGETILGITGTHIGGLKVVTGSVSNFTISSGYGRNITISNPGIVTKYAIVNFKANGNQVSHGYDLTTRDHLIPELNAAQLSAYMHYYASEGYVSINSADTLRFYLFYTQASYYSTSYSVTDISYILIGE